MTISSSWRKTSSFVVTSILVAASLTSTGQAASALDTCPVALALGAAGSGEAGAAEGKPGIVSGATLNAMQEQLPPEIRDHIEVRGLAYPAVSVPSAIVGGSIGGITYQLSRQAGTAELVSQLFSFVNRCPGKPIVLAGYSQGADAIGIALAQLQDHGDLGRLTLTRIAGVALIGDPRFNSGLADSHGDFNLDHGPIFESYGMPPGNSPEGRRPALDGLAGKFYSYCNQGDPICNFSLVNAARCFGMKAWRLLLAASTTLVIPPPLQQLLQGAEMFQESCAHMQYTRADQAAGAANTAMAGAKLSMQLLAAIDPPVSSTETMFFGRMNAGWNPWQSNVPIEIAGMPEVIKVAGANGANNHGLALGANGTVWAWGINASGELGNGTTERSEVPVQVSGLTGVLDIAAGNDSSMALRADGTVWTWGRNQMGQLGNGTRDDSTIPVQVSGLTNILAIAAGMAHGVALDDTGRVWAWGHNGVGELGSPPYSDVSTTPRQVPGIPQMTHIRAGSASTAALTADGRIWGWGWNLHGELCKGRTGSDGPSQAEGLTDVVDMGVSATTGVYLRSDGTVVACGMHLGNGTTDLSTTPVVVPDLNAATSIAVGHQHAVVIKSDGSLWAWGLNATGQLGLGYDSDNITSPQRVPISGRAIAVACGSAYTLAIILP